jgi:hypothetical protein
MDPKTHSQLAAWRASLTPKERELHDLAAVMLKKTFVLPDPKQQATDNGSYFPEKSHAFRAWLKKSATS